MENMVSIDYLKSFNPSSDIQVNSTRRKPLPGINHSRRRGRI